MLGVNFEVIKKGKKRNVEREREIEKKRNEKLPGGDGLKMVKFAFPRGRGTVVASSSLNSTSLQKRHDAPSSIASSLPT